MDINESLEKTILNEKAINSELSSNMNHILFTLRTLNDSVGLDVKRLKPLIDNLYVNFFYHSLNYVDNSKVFEERLYFIINEHNLFFKNKLEESEIYNECVKNLFGGNGTLSEGKKDFIRNKLNFKNLSDDVIRRIALQLLKYNANKELSCLFEKKVVDCHFFNKTEENTYINNNYNLEKLSNPETLKIFLDNGLNLNDYQKLTCVIGILGQKNQRLKEMLKENLEKDKYKLVENYVYDYENKNLINLFRNKLKAREEFSDNDYYKLIAFRDFWKFKLNGENVFYNLIQDQSNHFKCNLLDEKILTNLITKIKDDVINKEKYINLFKEKNKDGLNMLEIILHNYSDYKKCELDEEWLSLLIKNLELEKNKNYGYLLRNLKISDNLNDKLYEKMRSLYDVETLFNMLIGDSSEEFEKEIKNVIQNERNHSPDVNLLTHIEYFNLNNKELFKNPYISGAIYLYLSYLNEKSPGFIKSDKNRQHFYEEIKNNNPLLHDYNHSNDSLKIYISEMEKNHLLSLSPKEKSEILIKKNKRL